MVQPAGKGKVRIGIDIGSTSSDVVVLDHKSGIVWCDYRRTIGRPTETVRGQLEEVFGQISPSDVELTAVTGSAGRFFAKLAGVTFVNEVPAQAAAVFKLYPNFRQATIIEMGGQDSKLIFLSSENGHRRIKDFALNTVCAAGTGSFLDQQAQRLGVDIENEFGQLALVSRSVPRMAGRCSVFAKSDMIHLQQQATPNCDIIAGLCLALARNLKSNLGSGREFVKPIVFTGGVAANIGVVRALEEVFGLAEGELFVPDEHFFTGALGAVVVAERKVNPAGNGKIGLESIDSYLSKKASVLSGAPRREALARPSLPPPVSFIYEGLVSKASGPINAYLGVDVGSISTNVVVMDEQKRVFAKAYLMTAGKPLEAVRKGLEIVGGKTADKVRILGAATTGSGRYLTGDFIGADIVINEITAQAAGATIVNPKVDTIFEIGGQDSKYISLENGVVVDFAMNHACAAGTGSFLEEQAQRLDININEEFAKLAFESDRPIKLGERCTVFMESDLLSYQQQGADRRDLVAGLGYSIVSNYLNRVVGRRRIGDNICFQGGTAFNKAVWSAFEKVTGKKIMVPSHHEVTGALGAASIAAEHMEKLKAENDGDIKSGFRGFENLVSVKYSVESFTCEHCPNHCEIKKVQLRGAEPLYYGSRCDRYNLKKRRRQMKGPEAFEYRNHRMLEYAGLNSHEQAAGKVKGKIGVPMALINWHLLPLFSRFLKELGFKVVLSGATNKQTVRRGVESVTAQTCFPVKVAYGHIAELIDKKVDYIFVPSIVSMKSDFPANKHNQLCPYVQSLGYQLRSAFGDKLDKTKLLTVPVYLGEGRRLLEKSFTSIARGLGMNGLVGKAIKKAIEAQEDFENDLKQKGSEILDNIGSDEELFVLVSRPYNGCDDGLNLQLPRKLTELGVKVIPIEMLDLAEAELSDETLHNHVYWSYGQKILRAAEIIKRDKRLFAIYLSNFGCGPDSFIMTFFKDIMGQKPSLQLELDEHSADAGVITRLEAFLESLKHYQAKQIDKKSATKGPESIKLIGRDRKLYIPYMGDCSYGVAACLRAYGQSAEVMPLADEESLLQGRQFTSGKECLPCAITTGDMLKVIKSKGCDNGGAAFFMPGSLGPCRFGMYNCLHRLILNYAGASDVSVISPNQDGSFYAEFAESIGGASKSVFMKDMWLAAVGVDLLRKVILQIRPFAKDAGAARDVYERSVKKWVRAGECRKGLRQMRRLMESIAEELAAVEADYGIEKPRIGVVGEIYVRNHPFANGHIIARLEKLGAACDLASTAEWIYYTNFCRGQAAKRHRKIGSLVNNRIQNFIQHWLERFLAGPLEARFGKLAEGPIEHVIDLARPYLHFSFEGEAVLSIGKMVEYYRQGMGGVVNVMPFSCMPSTIVSGQTRRISADCGDMPILNVSFDGQEDATLTTRLEAFVEQVASRSGSEVNLAQQPVGRGV